MTVEHISIIGGGIAGLSAAIAAAKTGRSVTIFEKAEKFEPIGAGLQLGPNAVRALKAISAWNAVEPITSSPSAIHMYDGLNGKLLKKVTLDRQFESRFGEPYRVALRADLHSALLAVVQTFSNIEIRMGQGISSLTTGATLVADGIWSKSREQLFPNAKAETIADKAFRSLISTSAISEVDLSAVTLWLVPGGHVVHYQAGTEQKLNLVAITNGPNPNQFFANSCCNLKSILNAAPGWTEWPLAYVPPLPTWTKNNMTLIGDAAHGTLPYLAQGAAMALEDAASLFTSNFDLMNFYNKRAARCKRLHQSSIDAGRIYHLKGPAAKARNFALTLMPEQSFLSRLDWLYKT